MRKTKDPTRLGRYVLARMAELGMARQVDLTRATGISESTVSRIVLADQYLPDRDTLIALAGGLQVDPAQLVLFVYDLENAPKPQHTQHPRAAELDRLLGPNTRLDPADRDLLDAMVGRLIEPYRKPTSKRRAG